MGWSFRKSINIGPVRVNLSKAGIGASIGVKGFRKGIDAKGRKFTHSSIPGTGIYNRTYNKGVRLDDQALAPGEFKKLSGAGKTTIAFLVSVFILLWFAGESFWFAFFLCTVTAIITSLFSKEKIFDTYVKRNDRDSSENDIQRLEEELAQLEELEELESNSPFAVFDLTENCAPRELNHAFKKK